MGAPRGAVDFELRVGVLGDGVGVNRYWSYDGSTFDIIQTLEGENTQLRFVYRPGQALMQHPAGIEACGSDWLSFALEDLEIDHRLGRRSGRHDHADR